MGGQINIAARFNDGEAICVDGWTNFIPRMVMNETTLSGDDSVVRETLLETLRHDSYAGPQPFRASGYGIVVVDFIDRTIHSMQGYTSFSGHRILGHFMDFNESGWQGGGILKGIENFLSTGSTCDYRVTFTKEGLSLLHAGRVLLAYEGGEEIDPRVLTEEEARTIMKEDAGRFLLSKPRPPSMAEVNLAPFKVFDYPEGGPLTDMKTHLRGAGFPLRKEDGLNAMFAREMENGK